MYVKKHYVYVQTGVILSLLHYSCDSMRLLCVVWCVGKRPAVVADVWKSGGIVKYIDVC